PLATYPWMLYGLPFVGRWVLLGCVVGFSLLIFFKKNLTSLLILTPFFIGLFVSMPGHPPSFLEKIGYVSPRGLPKHPTDRAEEITYRLIDIVTTYPEVELIVMPES